MKTEINDLEKYFEWWLNELVDIGFVKWYKREAEVFVIPSSTYGRLKRFKTKDNVLEVFNLFPQIEYSYDYIICWEPVSEYIFYEIVDDSELFQFGKPSFIAFNREIDDKKCVVSYVDVKPTNSVQRRGGKVSSSITFPLKNRMLWDLQRVYINKVVPMPMSGTGFHSSLFTTTFTPRRYVYTDGGKAIRKVHFVIKTFKEFLVERTQFIKTTLENSL